MTINTPYGSVSSQNFTRAKNIKLLICDVDGVFSDGRIYLGNDGEELKAFHTHDGFGIKALLNIGVEVAIITGRQSTIVEKRMQALGVSRIYQGQQNKMVAYQQMLEQLNLSADKVAYIGDDVVDTPVMRACGLGVAVHDAHPLCKQDANLVTITPGGFGAVRELCDLILQAKDQLEYAQGMSV
ncbi:3-deoxy-manno-octulosonate-8-phosphatase KdsC [Agarivorans sp. 1_MG-2023]|uniref:3-deoxy-manno-octulosonate-8-phosphatase KdsC n=1 Tax=Agarivorans sp. 1_MG-2023 TaxID=3062634 RepID=UPI0026E31313|nr:3-deoxy-manno-octulosonate-8-phosphatase KdsC [Agarivorans sp. 1_MG-2023]MDO6764589.1 3-deoxy-manno-octulosonate-8-phosphatase KdsC [Agarivorans sp. 1_MG-2023]